MQMSALGRVVVALAASSAFFTFASSAHAAPAAGDLVKLQDGAAVYYVGADAKRYVFPNEKTYATWYPDFSGVTTVTDAELAALPIGGNVTYRSGTRLIKIVSDPKVYAVEPGGLLRPIAAEPTARALYGADWNQRIDDVSDAFFTDYRVGAELFSGVHPDGAVLRRVSDGAHFYIQSGAKRRIADALVGPLRLQDRYILPATGALVEYPDGAPVDAVESWMTDTSQRAAAPLPSIPTFSARPPASAFIPVGGQAVLLDLNVASAQAFTVRRLTVAFSALTDKVVDQNDTDGIDTDEGGLVHGNRVLANLAGLRILDENGNQVFARRDLSLDTTLDQEQSVVFDGAFIASAGTHRLRLVADVSTVVPSDERYQAALVYAGMVVEDGAGARLQTAPAADIAGPVLTTAKNALQVSASGAPGLPTYVRGTKDAAIAGFDLKAATVASTVVTGLTVQGYIDEEKAAGFLPGSDADNGTETRVNALLPTVSLHDQATGGRLAGPVPVSLDGRVVFSGFSLTIPPGKTASLVIKGDVPGTVELETQPDRVSFDIVDPVRDVVAADASGPVTVASAGLNGGVTPVYYATIRKNGTLDIRWSAGGGNAVAGKEILLGSLAFEPKDDDYDIRTLAFIQPDRASATLDRVRIGTTTVDVIGNVATFSGSPFVAPRGVITTVEVYGQLTPRGAGAVYGEVIGLKLASSGPFTFASRSTGEVFDADDLGTDFKVSANPLTEWTVRFSALSAAKAADSPSGEVIRTDDAHVFTFDLKTDPAGPVRLKKLTFRLIPSDVGRAGANNDALERWADLNGDFNDDDAVGTLRRVVDAQVDPELAEGSSGNIRFSIVHAGVENASPSALESSVGDHGLLEFEFPSGGEYALAAGSTATFSLSVAANAFSETEDGSLDTALLSGTDFIWTDIPSGAYPPLSGTDAAGLGFSSVVIITR